MTVYQRPVTYDKETHQLYLYVCIFVFPSLKAISCSDSVPVYPFPEGGGRDSVLCHFCDPNGPRPPALRGCGLALRQRRRPPPLRSGGRGLFVYCLPGRSAYGFVFSIFNFKANVQFGLQKRFGGLVQQVSTGQRCAVAGICPLA